MLDEVTALKNSLESEKQSLDSMKVSLETKKQSQVARTKELETAIIFGHNDSAACRSYNIGPITGTDIHSGVQLFHAANRMRAIAIRRCNGGRMAIFNRRLKEMYQYGDVSFLEVLLQSNSITDFLTRFEYLSNLCI